MSFLFHKKGQISYGWGIIIIITINIIIIIITIMINMLTHRKTILENTVEIEPQPVALDFKNLSQNSCHSK